MSLEVIGAGFGRTGTMSLKVALEELGFGPCYHMIELFEHPEHVPLWEAAARGELVEWGEILDGYRSTVDWPGCTFYKELMEAYLDACIDDLTVAGRYAPDLGTRGIHGVDPPDEDAVALHEVPFWARRIAGVPDTTTSATIIGSLVGADSVSWRGTKTPFSFL